mmetsp:Transcript_9620/g.9407  ORF Transcript_9620/g.9407 Transcript_9620/m.9407 type:complete len:128 (-) Transcript_9620:562-945(-)
MITNQQESPEAENLQAALPFDKTGSTFTQSLNGFTEAQSSNTLRNSVSPISFPKAKRFHNPVPPGASVPFYDTTRKYDRKKGAGFGYGKKVNPIQKTYSPGPGRYDNPPILYSSPYKDKSYKKGKFG